MAVVKCDFFILFDRFFCENSYDNAFTFSPLLKFLKYFIKCRKYCTLYPNKKSLQSWELFKNHDNDGFLLIDLDKIMKKVPICALLIDRDPEKEIRSRPFGLKIYFYYYHRIILYWDFRLSLWYMRRIRAKDTFQRVNKR